MTPNMQGTNKFLEFEDSLMYIGSVRSTRYPNNNKKRKERKKKEKKSILSGLERWLIRSLASIPEHPTSVHIRKLATPCNCSSKGFNALSGLWVHTHTHTHPCT